MPNVVVVGAQWGDEGKGKIVDNLSCHADLVVRFHGGHNAGHTLVVKDLVIKLALVPSGILWPHTLSLIGSGVVVDPYHLLKEIEGLRTQGVDVTPKRLKLSYRCPLILSLHQDLDSIAEQCSKDQKIGTTLRGIGPAYEDHVGRRAIRIVDLTCPKRLKERIDVLLARHNPLRQALGLPPCDPKRLHDELMALAPQILPYVTDSYQLMHNALRQHKNILFEGAQGVMLDIDHGTYPYVTSSNCVAPQAAIGAGVPISALNHILGIYKAYATRVGEGPFPTEEKGPLSAYLQHHGNEIGVNTGRIRRCGWFDGVLARHSVTVSGLTGFGLTKLDILDHVETIKICTAYSVDGIEYTSHPPACTALEEITPIYESFEGWMASTQHCSRFEDLPHNAQRYVKRIEELLDIPLVLLSTSPDREQTIILRNLFAND